MAFSLPSSSSLLKLPNARVRVAIDFAFPSQWLRTNQSKVTQNYNKTQFTFDDAQLKTTLSSLIRKYTRPFENQADLWTNKPVKMADKMAGFCQRIHSILTCRSCFVLGICQPSSRLLFGSISCLLQIPNTQPHA